MKSDGDFSGIDLQLRENDKRRSKPASFPGKPPPPNLSVYAITAAELAKFEGLCVLDLEVCAELEKVYERARELMARHLEICGELAGVELTGRHRDWSNLQGLGQHTLWRAAAEPILAAGIGPLRNFDTSLPVVAEGPHQIGQIQAAAVKGVLDKLRRVVSG